MVTASQTGSEDYTPAVSEPLMVQVSKAVLNVSLAMMPGVGAASM